MDSRPENTIRPSMEAITIIVRETLKTVGLLPKFYLPTAGYPSIRHHHSTGMYKRIYILHMQLRHPSIHTGYLLQPSDSTTTIDLNRKPTHPNEE